VIPLIKWPNTEEVTEAPIYTRLKCSMISYANQGNVDGIVVYQLLDGV
jgi:hypothetical protein